jgi:hypothetical protein
MSYTSMSSMTKTKTTTTGIILPPRASWISLQHEIRKIIQIITLELKHLYISVASLTLSLEPDTIDECRSDHVSAARGFGIRFPFHLILPRQKSFVFLQIFIALRNIIV